MQHQSLYRRFRPQRFAEVVGQPHLVRALRNAVREDRVGHAYLLSGPRGTGKTSTARILAKALNCEALGDDGEPCDECERCQSVTAGRSMDLIELDAASHNSVNHIRDMTEKAALVGAGRRKVYLLDEVHMLSTAASNALLKTLEEPPSHVVFILATTDPQKVLPTIRSRTQQFELALVGAEEMAAHVRAIAEAADAPIDERVVDYVVERGGGSVRDALSALDTVLAAGGIPDERADVDAVVKALAAADLAATLIAVADAASAGVDCRDLAERTARRLRDMFLVGAGVDPAELPPDDIASARELADAMGRRANVRALEALGAALAQMPQSADRRLTLEAALVGLLADEVLGAPDQSGPAAARAAMAAAKAPPSLETPAPAPPPAPAPAPAPPASAPPPAPTPPPSSPASAPPPPAPPSPASAPPPPPPAPLPETAPAAPAAPEATDDAAHRGNASAGPPQIDAAGLQAIWAEQVAPRLKPHAQGLFIEAVVVAVERNVVSVRVPHPNLVGRARKRSNEVEAVLGDLLDRTIRVDVVDSSGPDTGAGLGSGGEDSPPHTDSAAGGRASTPAPPPPAAAPPHESASPPAHGSDAGASASSQEDKVQRILDRFPGSTVVRADEGTT